MRHIVPYDEANVATDQPWLTPEDHAAASAINTVYLQQRHEDMEQWMVEHLEERASDGDQEAISKLWPFCHYILTTDFRIVQEPNCVRWGIFLERGLHRVIDRTDICAGVERDREYRSNSWAAQQRHKRKHPNAPRFKIEETYVSTVFIGTGDEELFETMIFGGWLDMIRWKTSTLESAKKAHWSAVTLAHLLKRYIKRHGKSVRKDWIRLDRFWELARKRDAQWVLKHIDTLMKIDGRLGRVPGHPVIPQADQFVELAQQFVARRGIPA
jgi:hypothetical protein